MLGASIIVLGELKLQNVPRDFLQRAWELSIFHCYMAVETAAEREHAGHRNVQQRQE